MEIKIVELSSGFANVQNNFVLAENYYGKAVGSREGNAYDKEITVSFPHEAEIYESGSGSVLALGDMICGDIFKEGKNLFGFIFHDKNNYFDTKTIFASGK